MKNDTYPIKDYLAILHDYVIKFGISPDFHIDVNILFAEYLKESHKSGKKLNTKIGNEIIKNVRKDSKYPAHLKVVFIGDYFQWRDSKLIADTYKIWKQNSESIGNWFGSIGDKIEISVKTLYVRKIENEFGITFLTKFEDENKNVFVAFLKFQLEIGESLKISAKIKNHSQFENQKQNEIFYVKRI